MTIIARCGRRQLLRLRIYPPHLRSANVLPPVQSSLCNYFHNSNRIRAPLVGEDGRNTADVRNSTFWKEYNRSFQVLGQPFGFRESFSQSDLGQKVCISGFLGKRRDLADKLSFADIQSGRDVLQIISVRDGTSASDEAHDTLKSIKPNSSVFITGLLQKKRPAKGEKPWEGEINERIPTNSCEIKLESIKCLNAFPDNIIVGDDTKFLPEARHLQIRFDGELEQRLVFRSKLSTFIRSQLEQFSFIEVETPILFKSTPEGAREFLVPTRRAGYCYALPQSPQQYKQMLMASGIPRYYQFARCFRDEDLRADRQPEFTQIDLEMACGSGEVVMQRIEELVKSVYSEFGGRISGHITNSSLSSADWKSQEEPLECSASEQNHHQTQPFPRMSYAEAMTRYGSDKPDLRIKDLIHRIDEIVPSSLAGMLTSIQTPIIEACRFRLKGDPKTVQKFIVEFMDSPEAEQFSENSDGPPGVFTIDSTKPLGGLQAFGFEGAENLKSLLAQDSAVDADSPLEDGDLLIIQARENLPHTGGSTALGRLRIALYKQAVAQGLLEPDPQHHYLWVTNFPLFTLNNGVDPGQGGMSGFSATHHPFTAPKTAQDVDLLLTDPLKVMADHYDLVVNGVELGGGSRRIHNAEMQKFVMRNILKMNEERINDFSHLFEALRAGCPPHAGFAFGFDRLVAVLTGVDSVRDVIAFPKSSKGEDLLVNSPSLMTDSQQKTYHLKVTD